jgi:hypothetical protein
MITTGIKYFLIGAILLLNLNPSYALDEKVNKEKSREEKQKLKLIDSHESFRYPRKGFYHPLLSPDDRWLIYHRETHLARKSGGSIVGDLASIIWKKIFYTKVGKSEKKLLPLGRKIGRSDSVGYHEVWSPDGKILAVSARIDGNEYIILIDFSDPSPRFLESFKAEERPFQWIDEFLLYIDEYGNIMKKFPNKEPEKIVYLRSGYTSERGIESFQCSKNGTLVYRIGAKLFKTNLSELSSPVLLYQDEALSKFDISETGQQALILTIRDRQNVNVLKAILVDLGTGEKTFEIPVPVKKVLFSPDGTKLAYVERHRPAYYPSTTKYMNPHFFVFDIKTMQVRDYGFEVNDYFNWTPDGNHIIYSMKCMHPSVARYENGIFIMRVSDGKEITKVSVMSSSDSPSISHSGKYIRWQDWDNETFFVIKNPLDAKVFKKP